MIPLWIPTLINPNWGNCQKPPTLYSLLNAINGNEGRIKDLPRLTHSIVFDFNYPLSSKINKADFEEQILKHFIMRRIGYETFTAWQMSLDAKLNEIMPKYNIMFNALTGYDLFNDGEIVTHTATTNVNGTTNQTGNSTGNNVSDQRYSNTPQNHLEDVRNGEYVTEYNYNTDTASNNSTLNTTNTDNTVFNETTTRTPLEKMNLYREYIETVESIMTLIYNDLDELFYQLA